MPLSHSLIVSKQNCAGEGGGGSVQALSNDLERRPDCHKKPNLVSLFLINSVS